MCLIKITEKYSRDTVKMEECTLITNPEIDWKWSKDMINSLKVSFFERFANKLNDPTDNCKKVSVISAITTK